MKIFWKMLVAMASFMPMFVFADSGSPFDTYWAEKPDLQVSAIRQDQATKRIIVSVCNLWGTMTRLENFVFAVQRRGGESLIKSIPNVILGNGECRDFETYSTGELGVGYENNFYIAAAVSVRKTGFEKNIRNNKRIEYMRLLPGWEPSPYYNNNNTPCATQPTPTCPTTNPSTTPVTPTPSNNIDLEWQNLQFVAQYRTASGYSIPGAITAEVCNRGDISFAPWTGMSVLFKRDNYAIEAVIPRDAWAKRECKTVFIPANALGITSNGTYNIEMVIDSKWILTESNESNNSKTSQISIAFPVPVYSSISASSKIIYPLGGEIYDNTNGYQFVIQWEIRTEPRNVSSVNFVFLKQWQSGESESQVATETVNGSFQGYAGNNNYFLVTRSIVTTQWPVGDYVAKMQAFDSYGRLVTESRMSGTFHVWPDLPNLYIRKISQNTSTKDVVAEICNVGNNMENGVTLRVDFFLDNRFVVSANPYIRLLRSGCIEVPTTVASYGISSGTYHTVGAQVDVLNALNERSETDNSFNQSVYLY